MEKQLTKEEILKSSIVRKLVEEAYEQGIIDYLFLYPQKPKRWTKFYKAKNAYILNIFSSQINESDNTKQG